MKGPLDADNLTIRTTDADEKLNEVVIEPNYLQYMRENGYPINEVNAVHTVKRRESDTAHIVMSIQTLKKPKDHPDLDVVADKHTIGICDCWSFRSNSANLADGEFITECGDCVHIRDVFKSKKAKNDDQQRELTD